MSFLVIFFDIVLSYFYFQDHFLLFHDVSAMMFHLIFEKVGKICSDHSKLEAKF